MANFKIGPIEKICFAFIIAIILIAFGLFFFNQPFLDVYLGEDGIVEWLTVAGLLCGFLVCAYRFVTLFKKRNWWFLFIVFVLGFLLFIAAGEEISWGQRILGIQSSEYFIKNNAQGETNIHNLVVNGVKINKLVFSTILIAVLGIYLLVLPLLYRYSNAIKKFIDKKGEGMHHIAFDVEDIYAEMERLKSEGFILLNETPKKGADNKLVCFLHPKGTRGVLVELCQEIK